MTQLTTWLTAGTPTGARNPLYERRAFLFGLIAGAIIGAGCILLF